MPLYVLDLIGVAVFAASGALAADARKMDLFGITVLAAVTAIGGGTLRDLLLDRPVFWMSDPIYLVVILASAAITIAYERFRKPPGYALTVADAFGLGLFAIGGAQVAERAGMPAIIVTLLGAMTACAGGVIRDVLSAEVPLILKRDIYATAAILGVLSYLAVKRLELGEQTAVIIGVVIVVTLRIAAIVWKLQLPALAPRQRAD